jgi:hypothetical protein
MRIPFRRLPIVTAFRAAREAAGEFVAAREFDFRQMPVFLDKSGGVSSAIPSTPPSIRPPAIVPPRESKLSWSNEIEAWLNQKGDAPDWPTMSGWQVLAAAGRYDLTSIRRELVEEHLVLRYELGTAAEGMDDELAALPHVVNLGDFITLYDEVSPTGVATLLPDRAGAIPEYAIMLCPILAARVGLRHNHDDPLSYVDQSGTVVVRTIWWRDGGVRRRDVERGLRGEGFVVIALDSVWPELSAHLHDKASIRRWRHISNEDSTQRLKSNAVGWTINPPAFQQ